MEILIPSMGIVCVICCSQVGLVSQLLLSLYVGRLFSWYFLKALFLIVLFVLLIFFAWRIMFNYGCYFKNVSWEGFALNVCILVSISLVVFSLVSFIVDYNNNVRPIIITFSYQNSLLCVMIQEKASSKNWSNIYDWMSTRSTSMIYC